MAWLPIFFTEETGPKWTPCSKRPPEKGIPVIVTVKWAEDDVEVCTAKRSDDGYEFSDYGKQDAEKVLAWMPQTDPYEDQKDG